MLGKKLSPGDQLDGIPADEWSSFQEAAAWVRGQQQGQRRPQGRNQLQTGVVSVKNTSGYTANRFDVLGIEDVFPTPTDNLNAFMAGPLLHGVTPSLSDHRGRFAVLLEPALDETIVSAVVAGVTIAKLTVVQENHEYCDVSDGNRGSLESGFFGSARILWKESGTGFKWAVILIPGHTEKEILCESYADTDYEIPLGGVFPISTVIEYPGSPSDEAVFKIQDGYNQEHIRQSKGIPGNHHRFAVNVSGTIYGTDHVDYDGQRFIYATTATKRAVWACWNTYLPWPGVNAPCGLIHPKADTHHSFKLGPGLPGFTTVSKWDSYGPADDHVCVMQTNLISEWWCEITQNLGTVYEEFGIKYQVVTANPFFLPAGHAYDGTDDWPEIEICVAFPFIGPKTPNVKTGNVLRYQMPPTSRTTPWKWDVMGCGPEYLDDPIGTVKLWTAAEGAIPQGWVRVTADEGKFLQVGASAGGTFGTTGTDYDWVGYMFIERTS